MGDISLSENRIKASFLSICDYYNLSTKLGFDLRNSMRECLN